MKADIERKKRYNAPLHKRRGYMHVHVSPELRKEVKKRSVLVKKGDSIKVLRGAERGKAFKVASVDYKKGVIYLEGANRKNMRGKDIPVSFQPSNVMLTGAGGKKAVPKETAKPAEKAEEPKEESKAGVNAPEMNVKKGEDNGKKRK